MTKISQYSTDVNITGNDKWIGSDAQNFLITKNFTPNNLANFFNGNNVIDIGASIRYMYQTLDPGEAREQGTISFETEIGPQVNFSAITTFLIAKNTLKGNTVSQYLDFLVDSKVLLSRANNINIFGYYKITSIEPWIPNTNFFVVEVDFLAGNGFIYEDLDYLVSLVDKAQDAPTTVWGSITGDIEDQTDLINYISSELTPYFLTPTGTTLEYVRGDGSLATFPTISVGDLQSVTDEGNTTTNNIQFINAAEVIFGAGGGIFLDNSSRLREGTIDAGLGGSKGIAQICAVGYELKWEAGRLYVMNGNGNAIRSSLYNFNIVPTINDDDTKAYYVGSLWSLDNGDVYECTDSTTGAAVWELKNTGTTPTLQQVTDEGNTITGVISIITLGDDNVTVSDINQPEFGSGIGAYGLFANGDTNQVNYQYNKIYYADLFTTKNLQINYPASIVSTNKIQTFQDADGTIALLSDIPSGGVTSVTATSPITSSGGTTPDISTSMATNKLIGRSTAGVGVMEEITIGTGLTLSGGTLNASATGGIPHATASGTDTYTATVTGVTAYNDADAYLIRFTNGNTTSATLNINSLGAIPLYRNNDGPLLGGDILAGGEMLCIYNSTTNRFQVIGISPNSLIAYVTNDDSVTLTKGMPVYAFSGTGDRMTVKRANNTGDATSAQTVGLVLSTSIAANQKGVIMMQGLLDGLSILPTATWNDGDPVYLGATPGTITNVKPFAPNHLVYLGVVTTASNGAAGRMYVRVQNGYELQELHNVQAQSPSLNDTLWYDNTVSPAQWKTASIPTVLGFTPEDVANKENTTLDTSTTKYPTNRLTKEYTDSKVTDAIVNGVTTIAPSQNAVFDALVLKADAYPNYPFNTATNYFGLFNIVPTISTGVPIGSSAGNTNGAVSLNRFSVDKEITISDFAILQNGANDGASATVTLYIFDDTNAGLPGVKLHQETTAAGILAVPQKFISFTNNITLQKGNYWVALHFRGLNASGANPTFVGGLINQPNLLTSLATYVTSFRPLIVGATADLSNNPTITTGGVQNLPQIFIKM